MNLTENLKFGFSLVQSFHFDTSSCDSVKEEGGRDDGEGIEPEIFVPDRGRANSGRC